MNTITKRDYKNLLDKPKIIGLCADVNQGKSNLIYHLIKEVQKDYQFNFYSYGLRCDLGEQKIYSIAELESIKNSVIICDEYFTLFDLDDRKARRAIENTLRLINHNNNILILAGLPENFKKFISNKLDVMIFKNCNLGDFINGSRIKQVCINYKGSELGSAVLKLEPSEGILWDGHYHKFSIPHLKEFDTKINNVSILTKMN